MTRTLAQQVTAAKIASLNDLARTAMGVAGRMFQTDGICDLDAQLQSKIREGVEKFNHWETGNDPYGERDYGAFDVEGHRIIWKIDYYDKACENGSEDPSDPRKTTRVLTIMLAEEYDMATTFEPIDRTQLAPEGWQEVNRDGGQTAWAKRYGGFQVFVTDASGSLAPTTLTEPMDAAIYTSDPAYVLTLTSHDFPHMLSVLRCVEELRRGTPTPHEPVGHSRTPQEWTSLVALSIALAKRQIRSDIADGSLPASVNSWAELQAFTAERLKSWFAEGDYWTYGGMWDEGWREWIDDDTMSDDSIAAEQSVAVAIDAWLQRGRP